MIAVAIGVAVRDLIVAFSVFCAGACLYMGVRFLFVLRTEHFGWAYALVGFSLAGIVYLIGAVIAQVPTVQVTWRTVAYLVFLLAGGIGLLGMVRAVGVRRPEGSASRGVLTVVVLLIVTQAAVLTIEIQTTQSQSASFSGLTQQLNAEFVEHRIAQRCASYDTEVYLRRVLTAQNLATAGLPALPNVKGLRCRQALSKLPDP